MSDDHKSLAPAEIPISGRLAPVVAEALKQSPDAGQISALLDVQERWEAGQARKAYTRALVGLKASLPSTVAKDATVDFASKKTGCRTFYRHTTLAKVMDVVDEHLPRHGFAVTWSSDQNERGEILVTCRLTHEDGHHEETSLRSPPDKSGQKGVAQAIMSTTTYLKRYTIMLLLGLASAEEREPHGPRSDEVVDPETVSAERNRVAASWIVDKGLSLTSAEEQVGRSVPDWTAGDLEVLRQWVRGQGRDPDEGREA